MSISKRTRFEVFKRDGFACAYCGRTPPDALLECDHINPVSKGGSDIMPNLLTACRDCNRGKAHIPLTVGPKQVINNTDMLQEKEAQLHALNELVISVQRRLEEEESVLQTEFYNLTGRWLSPEFCEQRVRLFLKQMPFASVMDALGVASRHVDDAEGIIRYFCGVCWRRIKTGNWHA